MNKAVYYTIAGGMAVLIAASLIKKKPSKARSAVLPGPRTYVTAPGDLVTVIMQRFGTTFKDLMSANQETNLQNLQKRISVSGSFIKLPTGVADMGARKNANGVVR